MKKLSAKSTFNKIIFPTVWFGFILIALYFTVFTPKGFQVFPFIAIIGMAVFGFYLFKHMVWDLVDEAWESSDQLIFKKGKVTESIEFSNIKNISYTHLSNPERVTISLREPGKLGSEISFTPKRKNHIISLYGKNKLVMDLIDRVDYARKS